MHDYNFANIIVPCVLDVPVEVNDPNELPVGVEPEPDLEPDPDPREAGDDPHQDLEPNPEPDLEPDPREADDDSDDEDQYNYDYPVSTDDEEEEEVSHDTIIRDWAQNNPAVTHTMINDLIRKDITEKCLYLLY